MVMNNINANSVRITHKPSGITAMCGSERGQFRNRQKALELLRARLWASGNVERKEVLVRAYDLPDGAWCIPDDVLVDIGSKV